MFRTFVEIILSTITSFYAFSSTIILFTTKANTSLNQRISYVVATKSAIFSITPKLITNPLLRQHTSNGCSLEVTAEFFFPINLKFLTISLVVRFQKFLRNQHLEFLKHEIHVELELLILEFRMFSFTDMDKFATWMEPFYHVEIEYYKLELQILDF